MQLLNALVAITGDRNNMLLRTELTPAEIILLQQLHGDSSVSQIEPVGEVKREPQAEIERLKWLYPRESERIQNIWRDHPGAAFPTRLDMLLINPAFLKSAESSQPYMVDAKVA
jgi:hypothetical protein